MLREIIEDINVFFRNYFEIYEKIALIPLSKIQELIDSIENVIETIGEKSIYSCSELAINSIKTILQEIEETAHESIDLETCIVDINEMSETLNLHMKIAS